MIDFNSIAELKIINELAKRIKMSYTKIELEMYTAQNRGRCILMKANRVFNAIRHENKRGFEKILTKNNSPSYQYFIGELERRILYHYCIGRMSCSGNTASGRLQFTG